jgi:D-alanyl-D-alanine carboxypeptidase/D-alanyl-D-alanine-endopeptidase (penicillin-binding protein 4)
MALGGPSGGARAGLALALACAVLCAGQAQAQSLQGELRSLIASKKLGAARVGVCIIDARTNEVLASVRADEGFTPASNMKVLSSGAAMMVLGPEYAFRTELALDGERLVVRGGGDPALGDPEVLKLSEGRLTVEDVLATLAGAVTKAGAGTVGEIVIDDRVFDRQYVHPAWDQSHLQKSYAPQLGGVNFHANVLSVFPAPTSAGQPPSLETQPRAPWLAIDASRAKTVKKNDNNAWLIREGDENAFSMRGEVGVRSKAPIQVNIHAPPLFFGQLLGANLRAAGVRLETPTGQPAPLRLASGEEKLPDGRLLAVVATPIQDVLRRCNTDSENLYAEAMLKTIGHKVTGEPGSWTNGVSVLRMLISQELGPTAAASTIVSDGSGLSRENNVTPTTLARWLVAMAGKPWGERYVASFAKPGEGTLQKRFVQRPPTNQVRAKSGYIRGVRSLSGYVTSPDNQRRVVFAILINDLPRDGADAAAKELHEEVVLLADGWVSGR